MSVERIEATRWDAYLREFGQPRTSRETELIEVTRRLIGEVWRLREALEWIAHFDDQHMSTARTLHYDMRGKAREVLSSDVYPVEPSK